MIKKVFTLSFLILALSSTGIFSQTGKIAGVIKDAKTDEALIGANVVVEGTMLGAATDIDGTYVILNVPPGTYSLKASMVGYSPVITTDVRVNIDQTTNIDFSLSDEAFQTGEVVIIAKTPVVQKDVASSGVNLNVQEVEKLPITSVAGVVELQAGISGSSVRGGEADETVYMVNGLSTRNGRDNTSSSNVSLTSVEQIQVSTGGFSAEYGDVRSGLVNVVTKEGDKQKYTFAFFGRYSPTAQKHFGSSANSADSYFLRPFLDNDVAWVGTKNGTWDAYTQKQYPEFQGWNAISDALLADDDPTNDLTPEAAQELFLFQHRRNLDIDQPDFNFDMSFGGPVPVIGKALGDMRFFASYLQEQSAYLVPLSKDKYTNYNASLKLTSDISQGMKLMIQGSYGESEGTNVSTSGAPGLFGTSSAQIGNRISGSYQDAYLYVPQYFSPSTIKNITGGAKFTHVISPSTFYEASANAVVTDYHTGPGAYRDTTAKYLFGNSYWVDEAPYGFYLYGIGSIDGMRMGAPLSTSRDSSYVAVYTAKVDLTSQVNNWNEVKAGVQLSYTYNDVSYGSYNLENPSTNVWRKWTNKPIQGALYVRDKLEFKLMVATVGLRLDYSNFNGEWWSYSTYDPYLTGAYDSERDVLIAKKSVAPKVALSPRVAIAFPITENSKLFFNYGHFRDLPSPSSMYSFYTDNLGNVTYISNPDADLQKTVAYELGFEQNLLDQYLIRLTGYYKDVTNETVSVTYYNKSKDLSYDKAEPNRYRDIRGFEAEINKNRGDWFQGFINYTYMVATRGYFGWGRYYENLTDQLEYEKTSTWMVQSKPKPQPYARLNLDFFTPEDFGPQVGSVKPLADWRLNILSTWSAGTYTTWVGGGGTTNNAYTNNLQWRDNFNTNLKLSKNFQFGPVDMQLFVQINNVFNHKAIALYDGTMVGSSGSDDTQDYFKSLHLPSDKVPDNMGYVNVPGDDQPGDYNQAGYYVPIIAAYDITQSSVIANAQSGYLYYDAATAQYYEWNNAGWVAADPNKVNEVLDKKAYIDMPNKTFLTFLNPRDFYWGIRFNISL